MARHKIDYGIDLGTTNSAIARMENGKSRIIKSDDKQMDTTPSCVYFNKKRTIFVGLEAISRLSNDDLKDFKEYSITKEVILPRNAFHAFKRAMGTDIKYLCSNMDKEYTPEELSVEVLKKLKSYVGDEEVSAAVITIPMRFGQHQVNATRRAAELAGFQYIETLQEPIAASIAYGLESKKTRGFWLVFDLGGGTFDAVLLRVVDGIMKVEDSAGDTRLGGRDIDYAIVDNIFIPYLARQYKIDKILSTDQVRLLLRDALKWVAEDAKIQLSKASYCDVFSDEPIGIDDNGKEMELDIKITLDDYKNVVEPIYQRVISISKELIQKNNLKGTDLEPVILVGGPTYSQTLRSMLKEQLSPNIDASLDPMTCVARGAALYGSTKDIPLTVQEQKRDKTKIQLGLHYPETTVETEEKLGIKIERSQTIGDVPQKLFVEITRNDKAWSSGKIAIHGDAEIIPLLLKESETNGFLITLFDEKGTIYPCEPSNITILGFKAAPQIIPFDMCIEAAIMGKGKQRLVGLNGLEKNKSLPAKGKGSFKTLMDIRPGNAKDIIRVPIYGGEHGTRAILNNCADEIELTGEKFDKFLPKDSEVEITLHVDSTHFMKLFAYFPYIDHTVEVELKPWTQEKFDPKEIERELSNAGDKLTTLEEEYGLTEKDKIERLQKEVVELTKIFENGRGNDDDERKVKERLRDVLKAQDKLEEETEIPKAKEKLGEAMNSLLTTNHRYGNNETTRVIEEMQKKTKLAMDETKDIMVIQDLINDIKGLEFWGILWQDFGFLISYIKYYDDNFSSIQWKNNVMAKKLINDAKQIIATNPSKKELQNILGKIFDLLPEGKQPYEERIDPTILLAYR